MGEGDRSAPISSAGHESAAALHSYPHAAAVPAHAEQASYADDAFESDSADKSDLTAEDHALEQVMQRTAKAHSAAPKGVVAPRSETDPLHQHISGTAYAIKLCA
jgi:hypothetical protein